MVILSEINATDAGPAFMSARKTVLILKMVLRLYGRITVYAAATAWRPAKPVQSFVCNSAKNAHG
jgi:hypothetical protein